MYTCLLKKASAVGFAYLLSFEEIGSRIAPDVCRGLPWQGIIRENIYRSVSALHKREVYLTYTELETRPGKVEGKELRVFLDEDDTQSQKYLGN